MADGGCYGTDQVYESSVVRLSAERWTELLARLDRIEALLTRAQAESEWEWPDGVSLGADAH